MSHTPGVVESGVAQAASLPTKRSPAPDPGLEHQATYQRPPRAEIKFWVIACMYSPEHLVDLPHELTPGEGRRPTGRWPPCVDSAAARTPTKQPTNQHDREQRRRPPRRTARRKGHPKRCQMSGRVVSLGSIVVAPTTRGAAVAH